VDDNGTGFDETAMYREDAFGLMGIRERALMLGGQLSIGRSDQDGARISVRLPLDRTAPRELSAHAQASRRRAKERK